MIPGTGLKDKVLELLRRKVSVADAAHLAGCSVSYVQTIRRTLVWTGELQPLKRGRK